MIGGVDPGKTTAGIAAQTGAPVQQPLDLHQGIDLLMPGLGAGLAESESLASQPGLGSDLNLSMAAKLTAAKADGREEMLLELGATPAEAKAARQEYFAKSMSAALGAPGVLAQAIGQAFMVQSNGGTSAQAMLPILDAVQEPPKEVLSALGFSAAAGLPDDAVNKNALLMAGLDLMTGASLEEANSHLADFLAQPADRQAEIAQTRRSELTAPQPQVMGTPVSAYHSDHPSYEQYNVPPNHFASLADMTTAWKSGSIPDVRANSYTLGTYLGADAQKEGIVGQQVFEVLSALRHGSSDPAEFEAQLKGLNMTNERRHELAQLAPKLDAFRQLGSMADIAKDPDLTNTVTTFVESSHNWGPQPEDFGGCGPLVQQVLEKPDFTSYLDQTMLAAKPDRKPVTGELLQHLGYPEPISRDLQEASMGVQAVDRLLFLPKNAMDLVPLTNVPSTPPPFPAKFADKIPGYSKDLQFATKLNLAVENGITNKTIELTPTQVSQFHTNQLLLAYLAAGELSAVLSKDAAASTTSPERADKIKDTIAQLDLKRKFIATALPQQCSGLDAMIETPEDYRNLMTPFLAKSRRHFEQALEQAIPNADDRAASLKWLNEFAALTSLGATEAK